MPAQENLSAAPCCRICSHDLEPFMDFGSMPIANGFLGPKEFAAEEFFALQVGLCPQCAMVQLVHVIDPTKLFHDAYAFLSSTSVRMAEHFQEFAQQIRSEILESDDPFVVEVGSNDGIMLKHLARAGVRHLGIEPSRNVADAAIENGVDTQCSFFDLDTAQKILAKHGQADVICGANVISHIEDIQSVMAGVALLLKPGGLFIFEEPYVGDIIQKISYDQFYDEHVFYFSLTSLSNLLAQHDMAIVHAVPQDVHGGSMRYSIAKADSRPVQSGLAALQAQEAALGLAHSSTYQALKERIDGSRTQLAGLLKKLNGEGKRVVGYGATSKSTTITNYCGIDGKLIDYISDTTPTKQGKFSPGMHIPIKHHDEFTANYPDYALLFAWNHQQEIIAKEERFLSQGGKFISFVPEIRILD